MRGVRTERVADGVWIVRGGFPAKTMNVYLIEDGDGVTMFDAGISDMTAAVRVGRGPARRDHSGSCSATPTPTTGARRRGSALRVYCHPAERDAAQSSRSLARRTGTSASSAPRPRGCSSGRSRCGTAARSRSPGHAEGGRRGRRLPGDRAPWPRARADRAVPRVRSPGARLRLLLHARSADRDQGTPRACRIRRSTSPPTGGGVDPEARGAAARSRVAGPRRPGHAATSSPSCTAAAADVPG